MNVQKLFEALSVDSDNSGLGIICRELEGQGYSVAIDGNNVTSDDLYNGAYPELENKMDPLNFSLFKGGNLEQEFSVTFTDFHEIKIEKTIEK